MYYDKYVPYYKTDADSGLYDRERTNEHEFALMKSYYSRTARMIQERAEEICGRMDYEGSAIYDEHPDPCVFYHMCSRIRRELEPEMQVPRRFLDELVQVLLYQEVFRRRGRRCRCRSRQIT